MKIMSFLQPCLFHIFQYVTKGSSELHQRAAPKRTPAIPVVDERDDSVVQRVQHVQAIYPSYPADIMPQPDNVTSGEAPLPVISSAPPAAERTLLEKGSERETLDETPHLHMETDKDREARLDRQWKEIKVDVSELPGVYARLAKSRLTGTVLQILWSYNRRCYPVHAFRCPDGGAVRAKATCIIPITGRLQILYPLLRLRVEHSNL